MKTDDGRRLIDSNGSLIRVGWDEFDWFTIEPVEVYDVEGEQHVETTGPGVAFNPDNIDQLIEAINEDRP